MNEQAEEKHQAHKIRSESDSQVAGGVGRSTVQDHVLTDATVTPAACKSVPGTARESPTTTTNMEHINRSPSSRSRMSGGSSRSSATVKARRLTAEAQLARRSMEREQQLFEREQQLAQAQLEHQRKLMHQVSKIEELEMQASLAEEAAEERFTRSVSEIQSRTASWLRDVNYSSPPVENVDISIPTIPSLAVYDATAMVPPATNSVAIESNNLATNTGIIPNFSRSLENTRDNYRDIYTGPMSQLRQDTNHFTSQRPENHEIPHHVYKKPVAFEISLNDKSQNIIQTSMSNNALSFNRPVVGPSYKEFVTPKHTNEPNIIYSQRCSHKLDLAPFSGKTTEFLMFKRIYQNTQHLFTPSENLVRLAGALRGAALESVSSLLYTSERPEEVLDMLEQTFALPEMIVLQEIALVRSLPKISFDQRELNHFACRLRNCIAVINNLDQKEHIHSVELFHSVLSKLTPILYSQWKDFAYRSDRSIPKIQLLSQFLDVEAVKHNRFGLIPDYAKRPGTFTSDFGKRPGTVGNNLPNNFTRRENIHVTSARSNTDLCPYCNNKHKLTDCNDFKTLTIDNKWHFLRQVKICYKCLKSKSHRWKSCRVGRCGIDGCERFHNPLLHAPPAPRSADEAPSSSYNTVTKPNDSDKTVTISNITESHSSDKTSPGPTRVYLKIVPVEVSGPCGKYDTFALLDDGSTATLIDSEVAWHIGASGPKESIKVDGVAGMSTHKPIQHVSFSIKGKNCSEVFTVNNAKAMDTLSLFTQTINENDLSKYGHLTDLADKLTLSDATPKILLGAEHWYLTVSHEVRHGSKSEPVAARTALGWVVYGKSSSWSKPVHFINHVSVDDGGDSAMNELIKDYFRLEAIGISKPENTCSNDEKYALGILDSTAKRLPSGRFKVGLLWRKDTPNIPDSYPQALSRFLGLERRMAREPDLKKGYCEFIGNMLAKGYAEECPRDTYRDTVNVNDIQRDLRWYLPHFPVIHPQKRKLRVVHDAAAKSMGVSLNSLLLPGPDLLQPLLHILFRFREGHVAMTADVKEMFPQIKIRETDRDALRYIWRENASCELKEYRMTSVIFGAACSPCTALYIKNRNAQELQKSYPAASKAVIHDHYMDDYLGSLDDVNQASQLAADIVAVHK